MIQLSPIRLVLPILLGQTLNSGETLARRHYARRQPAIAKMHKAIGRHLGYAKHETLRNAEHYFHTRITANSATANAGGGAAADIIFDLHRFTAGVSAVVRNQSAQNLQSAGHELYQEIGIDDPWHMPDPVAIDFLSRRQNLLKDASQEMWDQVRGEIVTGLETGDSIDEMAGRISSVFDQIDAGRAETIASTETGAAYGFARDQAMQTAGVQYKKWLTSHLKNVRPAHYAAERDPQNQRVPVDQPFLVGGESLMFPGDSRGSPGNVINCHCVSIPVVPE